MGRINFSSTTTIDPGETGSTRRVAEIEEADISKLIHWIKEEYQKTSYRLYLYCYGKQSKSDFFRFGERYAVKVHWKKSVLPGWLRILDGLVASQAGFIEVLDLDSLTEMVYDLGNQAMLALVLIDKSAAGEFEDYMNTGMTESDPENAVRYSAGAIVNVVDFDNAESSTGWLLVSLAGPGASLGGPEVGH